MTIRNCPPSVLILCMVVPFVSSLGGCFRHVHGPEDFPVPYCTYAVGSILRERIPSPSRRTGAPRRDQPTRAAGASARGGKSVISFCRLLRERYEPQRSCLPLRSRACSAGTGKTWSRWGRLA